MYEYADGCEPRLYSVTVARVSLDGDGEGIMTKFELESRSLWETGCEVAGG